MRIKLTARKAVKIKDWACENGFKVDSSVHLGPQLLWLCGGRLFAGENRICVNIVAPKPREGSRTDGTAAGPIGSKTDDAALELTARKASPAPEMDKTTGQDSAAAQQDGSQLNVMVKSSINNSLIANIKWKIGDIIIVKEGEAICYAKPHDICLISIMHRTSQLACVPGREDEGLAALV